MDAANLARLVTLAAIWGSSFLFMRIAVPTLGPAWLVALRVGLAALFLAGVGLWLKKRLRFGVYWKHYLVLGLLNSALPFVLFGYAATTLPASLLSILNATAPIWGAIIGAGWSRTSPSSTSIMGLALGIGGVALLVGMDPAAMRPGAGWAVAAGLGAAFSYGLVTTYTKTATAVDPFANAQGSMWAATLLMAPAVPFFPAHAMPGPGIAIAVMALGIICSGVAYLLYFRLVVELGATSVLTVTFLIPVFGVFWGFIFLDEAVGWHTLAGSLLVIAGTMLVTGFKPGKLFAERAAGGA